MTSEDEGASRLRGAMGSLPTRWTGTPRIVDYSAELVEQKLRALYLHEAGHAVAMVLAGRGVKHVTVNPERFLLRGASESNAGLAKPFPVEQHLRDHPHLRVRVLARFLVETYAGPAAELRFKPGYEFEGAEGDLNQVHSHAVELAISDLSAHWELAPPSNDGGGGKRLDTEFYLRAAWQETCRMFLDERVWAATLEITEDFLQRPYSEGGRHRMVGSKVQRLVHKHLPEGWHWSGLFEIASTPDWPPQSARHPRGRGG